MRKLFVSTTHWLPDAAAASVPRTARASRTLALLRPGILDDLGPARHTPCCSQAASQVAQGSLLRS